jgi:CMP/dCMP kinase
MTIITISRSHSSGGDEIASRVCEILGYKEFDKHVISLAAQEAGLSEQEVIDYSEENYKIRGFLDRLLGRSQSVAKTRIWKEDPTGERVVEESNLTEDTAVELVQKAVHSAYRVGNLVIIGRGGQMILKDQPDVLHVRIDAPLEERIQRVKQNMKHSKKDFNAHIDLRREAQDWIVQKDTASRDYLQRFYQVEWDNPWLYHMVLNSGKLSIEQAAQMIVSAVQALQVGPERAEQTLPET